MTDVEPSGPVEDSPEAPSAPQMMPSAELDADVPPVPVPQARMDQTMGKSDLSGSAMLSPSVVRQTTDIPRRLLQKTKTEKNNYLSFNNKFDAVGSNGLFGANPSMVKFAGYELRKTHTLKVKLINNSPAPQRLHILPPSTSFFKIKYNKKGMVPSGISEDIYVQFTPGNEFKYFYDSIRIHCEGDKILIPIHAYPVINTKKDELLPGTIDLGRVTIGDTIQKELFIESTSPVNFEYEFKEVKPHPDIRLCIPAVGDIIGRTSTPVLFQYCPQTFTTAEAVYELRTSEFDFKAQTIRIVGNSDPKMVELPQYYLDASAEQIPDDQALSFAKSSKDRRMQYDNVIKRKNRTLLTDKNLRRGLPDGSVGGMGGSQILEKIPESSFKKKQGADATKKGEPDQSIKNDQMAKLSEDELAFLMDYRKLEDLERQKGIKFFECVGDPPMTTEFKGNIEDTRLNFLTIKEVEMREKDCFRFKTEINADKVVVPVHNENTNEPKWDEHRNNHFTMKRRLLDIFLKVTNRMIMRRRAGLRLEKIKKRLMDNGITNRKDCKKWVADDWKAAQLQNIGDGDEDDTDNIDKVRFTFSFDRGDLGVKPEINLPLEYETNIASFMEKIEANPVAHFDDLEDYDDIERLDFEIEKYKPIALPQVSTFDPIFGDKVIRPGCEYESQIRQIAGEPDLEKIQMAAHEQMELLKQKEKDIVSGAIVAVPATINKPFDYSIELVVREHPTLRKYCTQFDCTEVDPSCMLHPKKIERLEPKDEIQLRNLKKDMDIDFVATITQTFSGSFVNQVVVPSQEMPGNFGVRILETMPTNIRTVHTDQLSNMQLGFNCDDRKVQVPAIMDKPNKNDYLTDEESDEANDFELQVPDLTELIDQFEKEDEVLQKHNDGIKEHAESEVAKGFKPEKRYELKQIKGDKLAMLDKNITNQREKQMAILPGQLSDLNETIIYSKNKAYLR